MRARVVSSLATYVATSVDEFHEELLAETLQVLLLPAGSAAPTGAPDKAATVPHFAFVALKRGGAANGLGGGGASGSAWAGSTAVGATPALALAPLPYVSPVFESRITAIHALEVVGRSSPVCRDAALLLLLLAHGADEGGGVSRHHPPPHPVADDAPPRLRHERRSVTRQRLPSDQSLRRLA